MSRQIKHLRVSKKGRVFKAGSRININPVWRTDTVDLPVFDDAIEGNNPRWDMKKVLMPPKEFVVLEYRAAYTKDSFAFWLSGSDDKTISHFTRILKGEEPKDKGLPIPVLEYEFDGVTLAHWQEGRTRGIAAIRAGLPLMPVWVAKKLEHPSQEWLERNR